jgi:fatty-acid desaturase
MSSCLKRILDPPSYGFERDGKFYVPTHRELWAEFFTRLNIFRSRKNWLPFFGWVASLSFAIPLVYFLTHHLSFWLVFLGFIYSMVVLGSHGTFWLHRYGTHRAFQFKNKFVRTVCRNLVIKIVPEEIYIVSHHVHHQFPEKAGDPYNVHGGWLYCFLADVNHQTIRKDMSANDYALVCKLLNHTGVRANTYEQYLKWGSITNPYFAVAHYVVNWACWYGIFYLIGGTALATALFGAAGVWAIGIRTYNFEGHGGGKDRRRDGIDFNRSDLSINQMWPGIVAGEWHNNHHLYPNGARSGFLPYQIDLPWYAIWILSKCGGVSAFKDYKDEFLRKYVGVGATPVTASAQIQAE